MYRKFSIRYLAQYFFLVCLALCLSTPSIAQDLVGAAKLQKNKLETTLVKIITKPSAVVQPAARTPKTPVSTTAQVISATVLPKNTAVDTKTVEEKRQLQAKAMAHLKAMLGPTEKENKVKKVSPYEQLVKLAFKGKGENGINNYEDAATLFCQQARDDNDAEAQYALGWMYANGKGFTKDENIAAFFYNRAAAQGNFRARKALATFEGNEALAQTPSCMMPDTPPEPILAKTALAPAGSNGSVFYKHGPIFEIVERLAPQYHIETDLAMAFIKVESNFNAKATSPKNAQGLMQLIPATARRFNVKNPYNPEDNIKGGLAYLRWLMAYFEGDVRLVAAAYNAGEGAVDKYKGVPPYPETRKYVTKIYNLYQKSFHPFRDDVPNGRTSRIIHLSSHP